MATKETTTTVSLDAAGLLGVAFIVLKLTHFINWSWWWVLAPFWGGFAIAGIVLIVALILYCIGKAFGG